MAFTVGIASSDGKVIDQHFGSSTKFYVFEILDDGSSALTEIRKVNTSNNEEESEACSSDCNCSGHDESHLIKRVELLSGCNAILVNQIGKGAERLLNLKGINAFEGKGSIEEALLRLYKYLKRSRQI